MVKRLNYSIKKNLFELPQMNTKNRTRDFLLLIAKTTVTLIERTKSIPQETLSFVFTKLRETFSFSKPLVLQDGPSTYDDGWKLGLTSWEKCYSVFSITKNNRNTWNMHTRRILKNLCIKILTRFSEK